MSEEATAVEAPVEVSDSTSEEASQPEVVSEVSDEVVGEVENSEENQEAIEEAIQQLYEISIDGETQQVPLDELLKGYQLKTASNKRFQEAARLKKQLEEEQSSVNSIRDQLLKNPFEALRNAGVEDALIKEHFEDVLYQMYQYDSKSDEEKASIQQQRETESMKQQYEQMKAQLEEKTQLEQQQILDRETEKLRQEYETNITAAVAAAGLPNTHKAIQGVADIIADALDADHDLTVEDAVAIYKEETSSSTKSLLESLDEDALLELIGKDKMDIIRKKDIASLTNPKLPGSSKPESSPSSEERESASDFFDNLRRSRFGK